MSSAIKILITGGTFDKEYNEIDGKLFFRASHIAEMLRLGRCHLGVRIKTLMMVDSLYMTPSQRHQILIECLDTKEERIVVTHGTDTLVDTARLLGPRITKKTVVITGAMIPYKFGSSDGMFNLGSALSFAQALPPGVYIAMNGRYFPWDNVRKNRSTGIFEIAIDSRKSKRK